MYRSENQRKEGGRRYDAEIEQHIVFFAYSVKPASTAYHGSTDININGVQNNN